MNASDVMVRDVVTIRPDDEISTAVRLLADHDISALPVVDANGYVLGVLSEADLLHREEDGTLKHRAWWDRHAQRSGWRTCFSFSICSPRR